METTQQKLLRFIAVLFICYSIIFLFPNPGLADETGLMLLSDSGKEIKTAVISVNSARKAALRNASLISNIVNGLPETIKIYILTNDREAFTVARNPWPGRIHFIKLPHDIPITIWTQDPFLVLKGSNNKTTLLSSREFERAGDQIMAEKIAAYLGYDLRKSNLIFEGGNIVSDDDFVFVGANTIRLNAIELNTSEVDTVRLFESELGRKVLVVGPLPQPIGHIDMILTPIGDKRVVLADANAGAEIAQNALDSDPSSVNAFEQYCEDNFFGLPGIREIIGKDNEKMSAPVIVGETARVIEESRKIAPSLDGIAGALKEFGYTVYRVPFLYGGPEPSSKTEDKTSFKASYPMLTYNNVLIEINDDARIVYLPSYQWKAMDDEAANAWKKLGFKVKRIRELTISAMYGGALRCSVKILERNSNNKAK